MRGSAIIKVFCFGIFISSLILSPFILDLTLLPRLISCAAFLSVCFLLLYKNDFVLPIKADLILLAYSGFVLFTCLSLSWATNKTEALPEIARTLAAFLVFLFSYFSFRTGPELFMDRLRKTAVVISLILFVNGAYQYSHVKHLGGEWLYHMIGLNGHKNLFASFLFLLLFFLISGIVYLKGTWKILAWSGILLSLFSILFLRSKAVWGGLLFVIPVYAFAHLLHKKPQPRSGKWQVWLIVTLILANGFFLFALQPLTQKGIVYLNEKDNTTASVKNEGERLMLWNKTYYMVSKNPLTGVGAGNWQVHFPDAGLSGLWRAEDLNYTFQRPHNDFLWLLSETGWIGFNLFLLFIFSVLTLLAKTIKRLTDDRWKEAAWCLAFISGYLVISFFDFPRERVEHLIWSNLLFAIAYGMIRGTAPQKAIFTFNVSRSNYVSGILISLIILLIGGLRFNSEWHMRKLYDARLKDNSGVIISEGNKALNPAYSLDATSVPVDWYIGNAHAVNGNYPEAHRCFLSALELNPFNRNVLNDLGSSYMMLDKPDSAKFFYLEASRISPRFDDPKLNLAAVYIREKNYQKAKESLDSIYHNSERRTKYKEFLKALGE